MVDLLGDAVATARVVGALVLIFFLPGFFLVNALYPRRGELDREYDGLYRLTLGIVLSIALTVLWSFFLNSLGVNASTGLGFVADVNIAAGLLGLAALFFGVGWWRGAYPRLARLHPALARMPPPATGDLFASEERDHKVRLRLLDLATERERLRKEIRDAERRMRLGSPDAKAHYERARDKARARLKVVDEDLRKLEEERAAELY